jgi:hypothetical protein
MPTVSDQARARRQPRGSLRVRDRAAGRAERPRRGSRQEARRPAAAPQGPASRYNAKHLSALLPDRADLRIVRRHVRYAQRGILWRESRIERIRKCGKVPIGDVAVKTAGGIAHYAGLASCGSIWACPCCSAKIRNTRGIEASTAAAAWTMGNPLLASKGASSYYERHRGSNSVYMVTLTFPHDLGMRLSSLLVLISEAFSATISGRPWIRLRGQLGIVGTIRSLEVTYGPNGWHPHLHVLVFAEGDSGAEGLVVMTEYFRARWTRFITQAGYRPPSDQYGVVIKRCYSAAEAAAYIAKVQDGGAVGNELARGDLKTGKNGHRTPFQILEDFRQIGDLADLALWHEYEMATKGHQCITWSKGLKKRLAVLEKSDEEIAAEEIGGDVVMMIASESWRQITGVPGLPAYVLDQAEAGGRPAIIGALARFGIDVEGSTDP